MKRKTVMCSFFVVLFLSSTFPMNVWHLSASADSAYSFNYTVQAAGTQNVTTYPDQEFHWIVDFNGTENWHSAQTGWMYVGSVVDNGFMTEREYDFDVPSNFVITAYERTGLFCTDAWQTGVVMANRYHQLQVSIFYYGAAEWVVNEILPISIFQNYAEYDALYYVKGYYNYTDTVSWGQSGFAAVNKTECLDDLKSYYTEIATINVTQDYLQYYSNKGTFSLTNYSVSSVTFYGSNVNTLVSRGVSWAGGPTDYQYYLIDNLYFYYPIPMSNTTLLYLWANTNYSQIVRKLWTSTETSSASVSATPVPNGTCIATLPYTWMYYAPNNDTSWSVTSDNPNVIVWMEGNNVYANAAVPADTTTATTDKTVTYSTKDQTVNLSANVTAAGSAVNQGNVTFTVKNGTTVIGSPATSNTLTRQWSPMINCTASYVFYGVWGSSSSDVFALGTDTDGTIGYILHYDGSAWSPMISGTTNILQGVWGTSHSDVFAVGRSGTILHYNGSAWSLMISGTTNILYGVWGSSSSDVFAVGGGGSILHYDGSAWTPMISGTTYAFCGVWGSSSSDVFAVGDYGYILHYNGSAWSPMISGTTYDLIGVWGTSHSDVFAVGGSSLFPLLPGPILHFNGSAWNTMTGTTYTLTGVWGSSSSDVFAVGDYGYILHYNGSAWSLMISGTTNILYGVWGSSSSDVFAVGGTGGDILHYSGSAWGSMRMAPTDELYGVWGSSSSDVFAVGYGDILHYDGSAWSLVSSEQPGLGYYELCGVWGSSSSDVFAVGSSLLSCDVLHYNGSTWSDVYSDIYTPPLYGVWGSSSSDVFAVGGEPYYPLLSEYGSSDILHYDGSVWRWVYASIGSQPLCGVWGSLSSDVFAVGGNGTILHYDGSAWTPMSSGTTDNLTGVWGTSHFDVFAVGRSGTILHYDGSAWTPMSSGTTNPLTGVWGTSHFDVFAVGGNGTILHYDGSAWSSTSIGTTNTFLGVWGSSSSDVFAVGCNCYGTSIVMHSDGSANARVSYTLPGGTAAGTYTIEADYSDGGLLNPSSDSSHTLTVNAVDTTTATYDQWVTYSTLDQNVTLVATVTSAAGPVNEGNIIFTVIGSNDTTLGSALAQVSNGNATASFTLPSVTAVGTYTIEAKYSGSAGFNPSSSGRLQSLHVLMANVTVAVADQNATYSASDQTVSASATVISATGPVNEGNVTFSIRKDSNLTLIGSEVTVPVINCTADVNVVLPGGTAAGGTYYLEADYNASNFGGGHNLGSLTVSQASTSLFVSDVSGTRGGTVNLWGWLTSGNPVSGEPISFSLNGTLVGSAITGSDGWAELPSVSLSGIGNGNYTGYITASFAGDSNYAGSSGSGNLTVGDNTPTGSNARVPLGNVGSITFSNVTSGGITVVPKPDPSIPNFQVVSGSCYSITTTATYSGNITVSLNYDPTQITVPQNQLRLLHFQNGQWVDVTTSVDTVNHVITGVVTSLAPFVIASALLVAPTVTASPSTVDQTQTSALSSSAVTTGTPPYTYQWFEKGPSDLAYSLIGDATSTSYNFVTSTSTATGVWSFEIQVTDNTGTAVNSTAGKVTVNSALVAPTASAAPGTVDEGQSSSLTSSDVTATGTSPLQYQWMEEAPGGSYIDVGSNSSGFSFVTGGSTATGVWSFKLQVTDAVGAQVTSNAASVTVNALPTVSIAPVGPLTLAVGQSQLFTATASGGTGTIHYQWFLGGSSVGSDSNTYSFSESVGSYTVTCTVTDSASVPVTSAASNAVSVTVNQLTITVTQGANGVIAPGTTNVIYGGSQAFTITPNAGYNIASITVDGSPVTVTSPTGQTVSFTNVKSPQSLTATFGFVVSGNRHVRLIGSNNVVIITGGNNVIDATGATATTVIQRGAGNNVINLGGGNNVVSVTAGGNDNITTGNGNNTITITGNSNYHITTGSGNDQIQITGNGSSIINAGDGNNIVKVLGKGSNQITTGSGNDVVVAGDGNNIIKTGAGDDTITVGNGNNYVDGGAGYDVCIHGTGHNTILNCEKIIP